jgi:dihydroneopterin triphosphate diphosphatase
VSPLRPDLVDCWLFRVGKSGEAEILLIRRAPGRILPGLWQCVSGGVEPAERVALAALREVAEETGYNGDAIEAFFDLDLVNQFHEPSVDGILQSAVFALRVRNGVEPVLSHEHTAFRWLPIDDAWREVIWPGYRDAIGRVRDHLLDPTRAPWFRLGLDGQRLADVVAEVPERAALGVDSKT